MWIDQRFSEWKGGTYVPSALRRVTQDLEQHYQEPIEAIAQRYWAMRDREASASPVPSNQVGEIYASTDRYLYESSYFEALAEYQWYFAIVRRACAQYRKTPVLDFGGGAGGFTLALSQRLPCDYADVPGPTLEYARWRLARHQRSSNTLDATQPLPRERYGAIVTLDVLEHLTDLRATLQQLVAALRRGGWLITKSTFAPGDPLHLPQNFPYADFQTFNRLLADFGLTYRGRLRADPISEWRFRAFHAPQVWRVWLDPKPKFGGRFVVHQRS